MASPYRSSVAYRGDSFVSMFKPSATNQKGGKSVGGRSAGMDEEEKRGLYEALYSWPKKEEVSKENEL